MKELLSAPQNQIALQAQYGVETFFFIRLLFFKDLFQNKNFC
jgi:hypothetical protein